MSIVIIDKRDKRKLDLELYLEDSAVIAVDMGIGTFDIIKNRFGETVTLVNLDNISSFIKVLMELEKHE